MEVLLLQDITGVGQKDDLLVVGDGYALNFLLPQSKALIATPTVRRRYAERIRTRALAREEIRLAEQNTASSLAGKKLSFKRKASDTGKLYAAISEKNISEAALAQLSIAIADTAITVAEPIKSLGEFTVVLHMAGRDVPLNILVEAEEE